MSFRVERRVVSCGSVCNTCSRLSEAVSVFAAYYELSGASYGTEFTREQINAALASESPLDLVPSTDTNGHGTFLAGIAAGGSLPEQDFTGAAPECELIVVKLKQAWTLRM